MKTILSFSVGLALFSVWPASRAQNIIPSASAHITAVHLERTNVVVEVEVSGAVAKVTLESSTRVGRRAWEPRAVEVLNKTNLDAELFTFSVPISPAVEILRVRADLSGSILPASFYSGTNSFLAATGTSPNVTSPGGTAGGVTGVDNSGAVTPPVAQRSVVESDIWNVDGDTLYFFNQYRGLQVIDISNPDRPVLTGTYDLAAAGEQMYVIDHNKVVLLARDNCGWFGNSSDSRVILLEVTNGVPTLVKELPVPGYIDESRLVGTALYVVANGYLPLDDPKSGTTWSWGSEIVSFDLSDFETASQKSEDWVNGYGNVIVATDAFLFVAQINYDPSGGTATTLINCYDISSPDGTFKMLSRFKVPGSVRDKFKMQLNGDVFTVVAQLGFPGPNATYVDTFSLADPSTPKALGSLRLIDNEQLFATRFDGNRLYVVTYYVKDPLWIVDLSNPATPQKVGEVQIPGWSTFIQPLGDKLLTIGIDQTNSSWRTSVQLFDVANAAQPALLSKVLIGDQWSGSEANWDEKAFGVLPDDHLVLVPFQSSDTNGYFQGVQLIDLFSDQLVKRGVVAQNMGTRRATLHRGRILSLSGTELLTVDATDRDHPQVLQSTPLSWSADQVHLLGDYILEVDASGSDSPALRVVQAEDPSILLKSLSLTNVPYMGSTRLDRTLYVLQGRPAQVIYPTEYNPTNYFPIATNPAVFVFSKYDLSTLPDVKLISQTIREGSTNYFYGRYDALQVSPRLLVWHSTSPGLIYWGAPGGGPVVYAGSGALDSATAGTGTSTTIATGSVASVIGSPIAPIFWGGGAGHFIGVDIGSDQPVFTSDFLISSTNGWWNVAGAFTTNGLVYTSHQGTEFDPTLDPPPYTWPCYDGNTQVICTNDPPPGVWVQRYYLDVIDFNDPTDPLVRQPVNIPGSLIGIDHGGETLFTRGYQIGPDYYSGGSESIAASAYDGVQAHLISSFSLTNNWPRPTLANQGYIYLGNPPASDKTNATLEVWSLDATGKFQLTGSQALDSAVQQFQLIGNLLAVQGNQISIFDAADPAVPHLVGGGRANTCYGVLLNGSDGDMARGLWVPIGWYGVIEIPVKSP